MSRKVLVLGQEDTNDAGTYVYFRHWMHQLLKRMGYEVDVCVIHDKAANNADLITQQGYEFAVMVHPFNYDPSGWMKTLFMDGDLVPCFLVNAREAGAFATVRFGVTRTGGDVYRLMTVSGMGGEIPVHCTTWLDANTAGKEITPIAWETDTPANLIMWKQTSGTYPVYGVGEPSGSSSSVNCLFPILLQTAINDGVLSPPPRRAMGSMDLDDYPQDASTNPTTSAEVEALVADLKAAKMVTTMGMHASKTVGSRNELADVWALNGVAAAIAKHQVRNGGPIYPIEHQGSTYWTTVEISGSPSGGQTKSAIDTFYKDHIDNMHTHGIYQGWNDDGLDSYGYHYFNTNRVDDKALQLATPKTLILADPSEATAQAGYGWKVARFDALSTARAIGPKIDAAANQISDYLGIRLIDSNSNINSTTEDLALATNVQTYAQAIADGYLTGSVIQDAPLYLHGQNADDYNNASASPPLRIVIEKIGLLNNFCKDTLRCGHPSEYSA